MSMMPMNPFGGKKSDTIFNILFNQTNYDPDEKTFFDKSGNGYHGVLSGTAIWDTNGYVIFDSASTVFVTLPIGADVVSGEDFAIFFDVNVNALSYGHQFITNQQVGRGVFEIKIYGFSDKPQYTIWGDNVLYGNTIASDTPLGWGEDTKIIVSKKARDGTIVVNGIAKTDSLRDTGFYSTNVPLVLGLKANGIIRRATMWDRFLSADEMEAL